MVILGAVEFIRYFAAFLWRERISREPKPFKPHIRIVGSCLCACGRRGLSTKGAARQALSCHEGRRSPGPVMFDILLTTYQVEPLRQNACGVLAAIVVVAVYQVRCRVYVYYRASKRTKAWLRTRERIENLKTFATFATNQMNPPWTNRETETKRYYYQFGCDSTPVHVLRA